MRARAERGVRFDRGGFVRELDGDHFLGDTRSLGDTSGSMSAQSGFHDLLNRSMLLLLLLLLLLPVAAEDAELVLGSEGEVVSRYLGYGGVGTAQSMGFT